MKVHVMIPLEDGFVRGVRVFASEALAEEGVQEWLANRGITTEEHREFKADRGTGVAVWECEVEDGVCVAAQGDDHP